MDDKELIILLLLAIGIYYYFTQIKQSSAPVPSIGDKVGNALVGIKDVVVQEASQVGSFFQNDVANAFTDYGNQVKANMANDIYKVDTFFKNDVNNFFVDTIGGGVQDAAGQVKSFFEDNTNAVVDKAAQEVNQISDFFTKTLPSWFGF